jgi:hypothetical protein
MIYVMVVVIFLEEEAEIIKNKYKKIIGVLNEKRFKTIKHLKLLSILNY